MTVSVLASGQIGSDGTGSISGTHDPGVGITPAAVVVFVLNNGASASQVSTLTYGGVNMLTSSAGTDAAGEAGRCAAYYLTQPYLVANGSSMPTGSQTVALTVSGSASKRVYCVSLSSDTGSLGLYTSSSDSSDQANPSDAQSIAADVWVSGVACLFSGNTDANTSVANGAELAHADFSGGAQSASLIWSNTTVNNGTLTTGWTVGSDDVAAAYIYFYEFVALSGNVDLSGVNTQSANVILLSGTGVNTGVQMAVTTDASGNWTGYVPRASVPYVYCTYSTGGSDYTSLIHWDMDTTP